MIEFKDFAPKPTQEGGFFTEAQYESFSEAVNRANQWLTDKGIAPLNVETVLLPNVWEEGEGTDDPSLEASGKYGTSWHQIVRIWYLAQ